MPYINYAIALIALIAFFIFALIVLIILGRCIMGDRVLSGTEEYGTRILVVDENGNGDHTTIQAAIDAANGETPASDSRWLVLIAPGEYQEALTLYDYVDLAGYANRGAHLISPAAQQIIAAGAEVTISNVYFSGAYDPLIATGASFAGKTMRFVNCFSAYTNSEVTLFQSVSGTIEIINCQFSGYGRIAYLTTGTVYVYHSLLTYAGTEDLPVIEIAGAGDLEVYYSSIINAGSDGAAIDINNASATSKFHNSVYDTYERQSLGTYSDSHLDLFDVQIEDMDWRIGDQAKIKVRPSNKLLDTGIKKIRIKIENLDTPYSFYINQSGAEVPADEAWVSLSGVDFQKVDLGWKYIISRSWGTYKIVLEAQRKGSSEVFDAGQRKLEVAYKTPVAKINLGNRLEGLFFDPNGKMIGVRSSAYEINLIYNLFYMDYERKLLYTTTPFDSITLS